VIAAAAGSAGADYRIRKDYGGFIDQYKLKYAAIRDRGERVIIDGVCNSACTLVLGIVPLNRICVTPRASLGFHTAYFDKAFTAGIKVTLKGFPAGKTKTMVIDTPALPAGAHRLRIVTSLWLGWDRIAWTRAKADEIPIVQARLDPRAGLSGRRLGSG